MLSRQLRLPTRMPERVTSEHTQLQHRMVTTLPGCSQKCWSCRTLRNTYPRDNTSGTLCTALFLMYAGDDVWQGATTLLQLLIYVVRLVPTLILFLRLLIHLRELQDGPARDDASADLGQRLVGLVSREYGVWWRLDLGAGAEGEIRGRGMFSWGWFIHL